MPPPGPHETQNEHNEATLAHVLYVDIVGSSKLTIDEQTNIANRLKDIVTNTAAYQRARGSKQLISLPTGDGVALAFVLRAN
jgi:hypothetical protein